jgi:hypothetical protein
MNLVFNAKMVQSNAPHVLTVSISKLTLVSQPVLRVSTSPSQEVIYALRAPILVVPAQVMLTTVLHAWKILMPSISIKGLVLLGVLEILLYLSIINVKIVILIARLVVTSRACVQLAINLRNWINKTLAAKTLVQVEQQSTKELTVKNVIALAEHVV